MRFVLVITLAIGGFAATSRPTAPDFTLPDLEGHDVALRHYRGQVVLVNFWATWCAPCRIEIPDLMTLQAKYGARGFVVLGVAMDDGGTSVVAPWIHAERFAMNAGRQPVNYPILIGTDAVADRFGGVVGFPMTVLVGKDGRELRRVSGPINLDAIEKLIQSVL
jgi:thiol-disulfide isomerase/thioredoxin